VNLRALPVFLLLALAATAGQGQYLEATIPGGDTPVNLLWNPTSNKVYVSNEQDGSVTVIDGATNQVRATIPVADYPSFLCFNSIENKVYCTSGESNRLMVIDGVGDTLLKTVHVPGYPSGMAYNQTRNKLYVGCHDNNTVRVVDAHADTVIRTIDAVASPTCLLWHPGTDRVFCSQWEQGSVLVIDCATDSIVSRLVVGAEPTGMCLNAVDWTVYVAARYTTPILSATGDSVLAQIPGWSFNLAMAPRENKAYASSAPGLLVIDCSTRTLVDTIPVIGAWMSCDEARSRVYTTNYSPGVLFVVDAARDSCIATIPLGRYPSYLCWNSTDSRVYVTDQMDNVVYVIRDTSTAIAEERQGGPQSVGAVSMVKRFLDWSGGATRLLDMSGRAVARVRHGANDLSALPAGVYVAVTADGRPARRLVKLE
jgi:YVTN family beta-propeller protein